jgi:hypothetical protein
VQIEWMYSRLAWPLQTREDTCRLARFYILSTICLLLLPNYSRLFWHLARIPQHFARGRTRGYRRESTCQQARVGPLCVPQILQLNTLRATRPPSLVTVVRIYAYAVAIHLLMRPWDTAKPAPGPVTLSTYIEV